MDDVLDYEPASATLGKPGGADLNLGLATGPALYAWEEHKMGELIQRKFEHPGDVELVRCYIIFHSYLLILFLSIFIVGSRLRLPFVGCPAYVGVGTGVR